MNNFTKIKTDLIQENNLNKMIENIVNILMDRISEDLPFAKKTFKKFNIPFTKSEEKLVGWLVNNADMNLLKKIEKAI